MTKKKRTIFISILVLLVIVVISTLSYAYVNKKFVQQNANVHNFNCFDIEYAEEVGEIMQLNAYPQTDGQGLENKPYQITITNKCDYSVSYDVVMHKSNTSNLADQYVKVSVDGDIKKYDEAPSVTIESITGFTPAISRRISTGVLGPQGTRKLNIRTWMDENTSETAGSNKTFDFKVTIEATAGNGTNLLAKAILNQGVKTDKPDLSIGEPPTDDFEPAGSGIFSDKDDDGTSYYFRGQVENNYVNFAEYTWRIVRINGDGTIRLILEDTIVGSQFNISTDNPMYLGYTYNNIPCTKDSPCWSSHTSNSFINTHGGESSAIKDELENWYISTLNGYDKKIAYGIYCNDTSYGGEDEMGGFHYKIYNRFVTEGNPTLTCLDPKDKNEEMQSYGGVYKLKIGLLNADEMAYAGLFLPESIPANSDNYLYKEYSWWSMTPFYFEPGKAMNILGNKGEIVSANIDSNYALRPVINLTADTTFTTGDGSTNNAFEVE